MKITFITDEASQAPLDFLTLAIQYNIGDVELRTVLNKHISLLDKFERYELLSQFRDFGISVCCIDSSVFKCDIDADIDIEIKKLQKALDIARYFNSSLVRIFSFWRRSSRQIYLRKITETLVKAGTVAKPYGICLAIENGKRTMHSTGAELACMMRDLDPDLFCVLWDPANSIFGGTDLHPVTTGFPCISDYVRHVHLKDLQIVSGQPKYVEIGKGVLDIERQLRLLDNMKFSGYISLETHWRMHRTLTTEESDYPGGPKFSESGYNATEICLSNLLKVFKRTSIERHL